MVMQLKLSSLREFSDGKTEVAFDRLVNQAVSDCLDRAGDESAREVTLTLKLTPRADQRGECDKVDVQVVLKSRLPAFQTTVYECRPRSGGRDGAMLVFNTASADDVDQRTLDELKAPVDDDDQTNE